jgi:alkylhydroperoxidase family enzyme
VTAALPEATAAFEDLLEAAWSITDPDLLDLVWEECPASTPRERAALAYAEQFALDPNGVVGPLEDALAEHLGRQGVYNFAAALNALDGWRRVCAVLGEDPGPPRRGDGRPPELLRDDELPPAPLGGDGIALRDYRVAVLDPRLTAGRAGLLRAVFSAPTLDEPASEAARLRVAAFHGCRY